MSSCSLGKFEESWSCGYAPIEEHGIIGNMHTVACVSSDATISFFCYPDFDSPSIFASLLDKEKGGFFSIRGRGNVTHRQLYHPDTNVLLSRFLSDEGVAQVVDFMPLDIGQDRCTRNIRRHWLVREIECIRGCMSFKIECFPAFNYARSPHEVIVHEEKFSVQFKTESLTMVLQSTSAIDWELSTTHDGAVIGYISLQEGEKQTLVFREHDNTDKHEAINNDKLVCPCPSCPFPKLLGEYLYEKTLEYWRCWISRCIYKGRWREMVCRSVLALKLLTYEPTGAIVAAATTSLPEAVGGSRNWDYRFTWIRDSAFVLYAFMRLGYTEEANAFMSWIEARCQDLTDGSGLQIMYGIRGEKTLTEIELPHLEGYKKSAPVRIGNGAYDQLQLDIYGELLDTIYLCNKLARPISFDFWRHVRTLVNWVCDNWTRTDEGIWEVRGGKKAFTYSRLMSWVALDRGIRLAEKRSFPCDIAKWRSIRDTIYEEIQEKGYNSEMGSFVQYYGSTTLDASNLIMPLVFFMSPADPKFLSTLDNILKSTADGGLVSNNLVFRYNTEETDDGMTGDEGTFSLCTFWAVEALARAGKHERKYLDKARLMFEQTIGYANHLGLFSEEIGKRGEALGNMPQAFTHLALISSAYTLDRVLSGN